MLVPMREEFGVSEATVAGVFSVALAVSASSAPAVGRRLDRGDGVVLLRWGGWGAAMLLWAWSQVHSVAALYVVWIGLGAVMAMEGAGRLARLHDMQAGAERAKPERLADRCRLGGEHRSLLERVERQGIEIDDGVGHFPSPMSSPSQ